MYVFLIVSDQVAGCHAFLNSLGLAQVFRDVNPLLRNIIMTYKTSSSLELSFIFKMIELTHLLGGALFSSGHKILKEAEIIMIQNFY